ncbi:MAG: rhodanese-like domain-containing protein [Pirellula sp.]
MGYESIEATSLKERLNGNRECWLLDVRTPAEFEGNHIQGATNVPLETLDVAAVKAQYSQNGKPIFVICQSGGRSRKACQALADAGLEVINVNGGTVACMAAGLSCSRSGSGRSVIGLERQVRIAAGSLVLIGIALGAYVHYVGYGLSAFVGAGLVFAGVTDTCAMGMMLAKMPWNQSKASCAKPLNV